MYDEDDSDEYHTACFSAIKRGAYKWPEDVSVSEEVLSFSLLHVCFTRTKNTNTDAAAPEDVSVSKEVPQ